MQPLVRAEGITKSYAAHHVFRDAGFLIHPGDKIALVGPNGSGKTTLFRLLAGRIKPDLGTFETRPGMRIAYLPQIPEAPADSKVLDLLAAPTEAARKIQDEVEALEAWMAEPDAWDQSDAQERMQRYSDLQTALAEERSKGTATRSPLLNDLGIPEDLLDARFGDLSGGEQSKVLLCKTLTAAQDADLLLLDEPTNHMDIPTVEFIEQYLLDLDAAVVLAAHDQYLLDRVAERVFEVDHLRVTAYQGNYTSYRGQREALQRAIAAKKRRDFHEVKRQRAIIEELKRRNRFDSQVKSRKTRLQQRGAIQEEAPTKRRGFRLLFEADKVPKEVLEVNGVAKAYDRVLFQGVTFEVEGGDKIGIIGPNGCGKTTLLKILLGQVPPDAGEVKRGTNVRIGYFDQHHASLDADREIIDEVRSLRDPPPPDEWSRGLLGRFGFSGDAVFKRVQDLSGGERARLALAKFIADKHNVLVLDEPTNHLDLESQDIVADALQDYEGTLLIVSHDRAFLDRVCTRIAVIAHTRVGVFPGNFSTTWTSKRLAEFTHSGIQGRYRVRKAFRDWEKDTKYLSGDTIAVTGMETQAFRRMLRQAQANGWIEQES